ncbi:hypothetical protein [Stomatohabitans albus]|uniref:hypothetical protein n=1 Tax=Stomatohabitans albus TaxID=3110766 RepID=UPI00300DA8AC
MDPVDIPGIGPLLAELGVGMGLVVIFVLYVLRTWRDGKTTDRTHAHLARALELAERREAALTERMDDIMDKLHEAECEREQDRMFWETKLEANEHQLEETAAQLRATQVKLDETLARLKDAERQRDEIAAKAHAEKQQFEATIQQLRAEVESLRELVTRNGLQPGSVV